jgi:hypothetical protein
MSTDIVRRIKPLEQVKEEAGVDEDSSNAITKEQKEALAAAGTPFIITDMEQAEGDNGLYWILTIELEGAERVLFMGENRGNAALFEALHRTVVAEETAVGPMRLDYVPPRTNRQGEKKFGFYKLESAAFPTPTVESRASTTPASSPLKGGRRSSLTDMRAPRPAVQAALDATEALYSATDDGDAIDI